MLTFTHTHGGPQTNCEAGYSDHLNIPYLEMLENALREECRKLAAEPQALECDTFFYSIQVDENKNRRVMTADNYAAFIPHRAELRDPQNYPPGTFSDWDGEMHEIPTPQGMTDTQFINALQKAIDEYQNNCLYSLVDENCAAWVNSMLERVGIPKSERDRLGEFFGVDWGEEDLIPSQYFVKE